MTTEKQIGGHIDNGIRKSTNALLCGNTAAIGKSSPDSASSGSTRKISDAQKRGIDIWTSEDPRVRHLLQFTFSNVLKVQEPSNM